MRVKDPIYVDGNEVWHSGNVPATATRWPTWGEVTGKPSTFPPSSHTHDYLPLSGGTLTGSVAGTAFTLDSYILSPQGGRYVSYGPSMTGAIKITLPVSWNNTMLRFAVDVYNYTTNTSFTVYVGGYNFSGSSSWYNTFAYILARDSSADYTVRFGHDGSKCCIYIGETDTSWAYPQIVVRDVYLGYSGGNASLWSTGWSIGFATSFGTITSTISDCMVYSRYAKTAGSVAWGNVTGKPSTFPPSSHSHGAGDLPSATTSAKGVVQLSSAVNSTSTTLAATASAVKSAYDLAASKWTYNESTIKAVKVNNAVAADQLATARTINGTSFNGTANITTASWGTARTITIGNTGKLVDGSANVSWSLSEIGAAPASHTHSYLPLGGGNLTGKLTVSALSGYGIRPSIELQGVHANDTTNENSGAAIFFRTSTSAGYGPMISGIRRSGGAGALVFLTNTSAADSQTERMRITENGNVGIGTTSPSYPLHVIGDVGFSGTLQAGTVPWARISGAPATATRWPSWGEVTGKPSTFAPTTNSVNGLDMNNVTATGFYQGYTMTNSAVKTISTFLVINYSSDWISQTQIVPSSNPSMYIRARHSGTSWSPWREVWHSGNFTPLRTIKIGNTSKSVDGSADVTWTLSEIGAEPALAANRKRQIFVQSSTPSGAQTGDIWIVT